MSIDEHIRYKVEWNVKNNFWPKICKLEQYAIPDLDSIRVILHAAIIFSISALACEEIYFPDVKI